MNSTCQPVTGPLCPGTRALSVDLAPIAGSELDPGRLSSLAQVTPVNVAGAPPGSAEDARVVSAPSSMPQYPSGLPLGMRRRSVDDSGSVPAPYRRKGPAASTGTYRSAPDTSHFGGQLLISPWNR